MPPRYPLLAAALALGCGARSELIAEADGSGGTGGGSGGSGGSCLADGTVCRADAECCAGTCANGLCGYVYCQPGDPPEVIASGLIWPIGPVAHQDDVYLASYHEAGALYRARKDGEELQKIVDLDWPHDIALDEASIYVTTESRVVRLGIGSLGAVEQISSTFGGAGIGMSGDRVVWAEYFGKTIKSAPKAGGSAKVLASLEASPFRLQVHDGVAHFTAGALYRLELDGSAPTVVEPGAVRSFAVDADLALYRSQNQGAAHQIVGPGGVVLYSGEAFLDGVNVDADGVYVFANGAVMRLSKDGSEPPLVLWQGDSTAGLMAQDRACLYVPIRPAQGAPGEDYLLRIAKP
jgi:hypothetical protein